MKKLIIHMIIFSLLCLTACSGEKHDEDVSVINDNDSSITTFGVIKCKNIKDLVVPFNTSIEKILVHEGEEVVEGESLIELDVSEYNKQIDKKQAEIDNLMMQLKNLELKAKKLQSQALIKTDNLRRNITVLEVKLAIVKGYIKTGLSSELKKLALALEAAENDFTYANSNLSDCRLLYEGGAISLKEYQTEQRNVEAKEQKIEEIKIAIEAIKFNYESEASSLQSSIEQNKSDLTALETDTLYEASELQESIIQSKKLLAMAESEMQQVKESANSAFLKNGNLVCVMNRAVLDGIRYIPGTTIIAGSIIANVMDLDSLYVEVEIEEQSISQVRENSVVHIIPEMDKTKFYTGKVTFVSSIASQKNNETMISIKICIDNPDKFLIPNSNVKVKIYSNS